MENLNPDTEKLIDAVWPAVEAYKKQRCWKALDGISAVKAFFVVWERIIRAIEEAKKCDTH